MNIKQDVADSAVAAGISWLEERGNTDWWEIIDTGLFNLNQFDTCILGQIFGGGTLSSVGKSWPVPLSRDGCDCCLSLDWKWLDAHGFAATAEMLGCDAEIEAAWLREIEARRNPVDPDAPLQPVTAEDLANAATA